MAPWDMSGPVGKIRAEGFSQNLAISEGLEMSNLNSFISSTFATQISGQYFQRKDLVGVASVMQEEIYMTNQIQSVFKLRDALSEMNENGERWVTCSCRLFGD